jgi:hypothetical protein
MSTGCKRSGYKRPLTSHLNFSSIPLQSPSRIKAFLHYKPHPSSCPSIRLTLSSPPPSTTHVVNILRPHVRIAPTCIYAMSDEPDITYRWSRTDINHLAVVIIDEDKGGHAGESPQVRGQGRTSTHKCYRGPKRSDFGPTSKTFSPRGHRQC